MALLGAENQGMSGGYSPLLDANEDANPDVVQDTDDTEDLDIVQFNSHVFFADEDDGRVSIGIMRLGEARGRVEVSWHTMDGSAKAGDQYEATSGFVVFEDGERDKFVDVLIHDDDMWHATNEFRVRLGDPVNCVLGVYLHTARVKVLDNNCFPSDKYVEEVKLGKEGVGLINGAGLFWEFFKLNFQQEGIWWRTVLTVIFDQLYNVNVLLQTWMAMYMVDVVFTDQESFDPARLRVTGDRKSEVYVLAALSVLPIAMMHIWDYFRVKIDIGGHSEAFLRSNIVRRYMNLAEESRIQLDASRLQVAILDDTTAIAQGYCSVLDMVKSLGTVSVLTIFTLHSNTSAWWVVCSMPVMMIAFIFLRDHIGDVVDNVLEKKAFMGLLNEMLKNYKLISSYFQRPRINDMVASAVDALRLKKIPMEITAKHDEYFPQWMGATLTAIYIMIAGPEVVTDPNLSLGTFLATISVIRDTSAAFSLLYSVYMKMSETFDPVREITWVFSLKTDLMIWKQVSTKRQERTIVARQNVRNGEDLRRAPMDHNRMSLAQKLVSSERFAVDRLHIMLTDICFGFTTWNPVLRGPNTHEVLKDVKLSVPQGSIVAVTGGQASGKATVLQLIGHSLFPDMGDVFVPGHLRILQVDIDIMIFETWGPLENLTFGVGAEGVDIEKVKMVVNEMSMEQTWALVEDEINLRNGNLGMAVQKMKSKEEVIEAAKGPRAPNSPWHERLSATEKHKMCLARALIANPEVLILHKPFRNYREQDKKQMMNVVLKHVQNRGIGMPPETVGHRRPRTCFYSVVHENEGWLADEVWRVCNTEKQIVVDQIFEKGKAERLDLIGKHTVHMTKLMRQFSNTSKAKTPAPAIEEACGREETKESSIGAWASSQHSIPEQEDQDTSPDRRKEAPAEGPTVQFAADVAGGGLSRENTREKRILEKGW